MTHRLKFVIFIFCPNQKKFDSREVLLLMVPVMVAGLRGFFNFVIFLLDLRKEKDR